jgi:hypothetical protein
MAQCLYTSQEMVHQSRPDFQGVKALTRLLHLALGLHLVVAHQAADGRLDPANDLLGLAVHLVQQRVGCSTDRDTVELEILDSTADETRCTRPSRHTHTEATSGCQESKHKCAWCVWEGGAELHTRTRTQMLLQPHATAPALSGWSAMWQQSCSGKACATHVACMMRERVNCACVRALLLTLEGSPDMVVLGVGGGVFS